MEYAEEAGTLYYFKYPVAGGGDALPVATTRPETILGDMAVAVHPEDARFAHLVGRECEVPLSGGRRVHVNPNRLIVQGFRAPLCASSGPRVRGAAERRQAHACKP